MKLYFKDIPVGMDFYCFGARWGKTGATTAKLVRKRKLRPKARSFDATEVIVPVGGTQAFLQNLRTPEPHGCDCHFFEEERAAHLFLDLFL